MRPQKLHEEAIYRPLYPPGHIHGYRKDGRPIYAVAGGSGGNEPANLSPSGDTIVVPAPPPAPPTPSQSNGQTFTADDIEKARTQEKDKLYERLNQQEETLRKLQEEQQKRLEAEAAARKAAEDAAEAERKKNLTYEQKLEELQADFATRFSTLNSQLEQSAALMEAEARFQELQKFRTKRLEEEKEEIMPNLLTWVQGNSEQEIEEAIARAKETTASILNDVVQAQQNQQFAAQQARQQARGTGVTAPPVGPLDNNSGQQTYSADDIRNMSIGDYAKNRDRLLEAARNQMMRGRGQ